MTTTITDLIEFSNAFTALTGHAPFPWQQALYERLVTGDPPASCSLPTGLGKSAVIYIWLIALANNPGAVARRLVYIVNRRTVVDQATTETVKMRTQLLAVDRPEVLTQLASRLSALASDPTAEPLAISTLRGQFADNAEWRADPARPAVVVGTVDMIGSRLLFSGYGCGFKGRPLHAGFLGQHTFIIHDEAHLEPAFQELLLAIEQEQRNGRTPDLLPTHVMELTATSRQEGEPFRLTHDERSPKVVPNTPTEPIHHVWRRLTARKRIALHTIDDDKKLADEIAQLALRHAKSEQAVLVFVRKVDDVDKIVKKLPKGATEQLTGTLRGLERDALVASPVFQRFLPAANREPDGATAPGTVYLVCTSAGEVGIDISADQMVCDLTPFDSMAQRFGRVNRFGDCRDTRIDIVHPSEFGKKGKVDEFDTRRAKTLELLRMLQGDGCPNAIESLDAAARLEAFTPQPGVLPATDILFDAWALTTIYEPLPGRPPAEPYLHGVDDSSQPPQTQVAWREEVQIIDDDLRNVYTPRDLLDDYPLKPHELLRDTSERVFMHLAEIGERHPDAQAWIVDTRGQIDVVPLKELADKNRKDRLHHATVLVSPAVGGLAHGRLSGSAPHAPGVAYDVADEWYADKARTVKRRQRDWEPLKPEGMRLVRPPIDICPDADEVESESEPARRFWYWYERPASADGPGSQTAQKPVRWADHVKDVTGHAERFVGKLPLSDDIRAAVILAAKLHDLGKRREVWQRSIGNRYPAHWLAKSGKHMTPRDLCPDYRHEFGSLLDVLDANQQHRTQFDQLEAETRELVLHLIAAHHGRARPYFPAEEVFDPDHSHREATDIAATVPARFARLQRQYGRWGLAYLESLLRAADWAASANPSQFAEPWPPEQEKP